MNGFIGIIAEDRPALLIGLLGILKSGNPFVPINPTFPKDRINYIIGDCGITAILTDQDNYETAREIAKINRLVKHIVCIDDVTNGETNIGLGKNNEQKDVGDTCYVIYTSGSTGKSKGVPITHRHLIPEFYWFRDYMGLDLWNRVMQNLSYTFDFGVFEIFTTLLFGSSLYVVDKKKVGDFGLYSRFINMHSIDTAHSTPAFFNSVVSLGEKMPSLKVVHLGGERLTGNIVNSICAVVSPGCKIHNGYGPTEATINCSIYTLTAGQCESIDDSANIPIGRPTVLHRLYILDRNLRPMPEGMAGELCIAGAGLASGYLNNPELTAEKFKRSSGSDKTYILYKTGDLARWLRDSLPAGGTTKGIIEFLGRIDHQVKIRGYRIELGEIESCL
ncbi:MAG: hypothetical protein QG657_4123, partial [Acidobacteriota bacterium]|nr:hypothetical protein [Acidobacteriota bacterium]